MNLYVNLRDFKETLGAQDGGKGVDERDAAFLRVLEASSRGIDEMCQRPFFPVTATKTFDTNGENIWWIPAGTPDLLSVTALTVDDNDDGVFNIALVENTDYRLLPYNESPKRALQIVSRSNLISALPRADFCLRIAGRWGYTEDTELVTTTAEALDASETGVDFTVADPLISAGDTIVIDSEDMYVSASIAGTLTVQRAVNGTTAATHANPSNVYRRRYHRDIEEACRAQSVRWWREAASANISAQGGEFGYQFATLYPAIRDMLARHQRIGVG